MPRPIAELAAVLVASVVAMALGVAAAVAPAMPGDPPSEPLAPQDGASVPVDPDGIPVSFTCPVYRTYDDGQGFKLFGGPRDHGVSFSRSAALGADGRLADPVALGVGERGAAEGQCVSALGAGGASPRPQETPGTYYWQVWRRCTGCSGYETGPVRRIVLRANASLAVRKPRRPTPASRGSCSSSSPASPTAPPRRWSARAARAGASPGARQRWAKTARPS